MGKDPNRWALVGWAAYFVPASLVTGILLGLWQRDFVQTIIPLEAHFVTFGDRPTFADVLPLARLVTDDFVRTALTGARRS